MTFPGHHNQGSWGLDGHWHIDGVTRYRCLHNTDVALLPIFLFSDVKPQGGGTALGEESQKFIARMMMERGCNSHGGVHAYQLSKEGGEYVDQSCRVIETTGEAGDVWLTHPFLVHGRSTNCGESIRFMCHPAVRWKEAPNYDPKALSPVEDAVTRVVGSVPSHDEHCLGGGKRKRRRGLMAEGQPQDRDDIVEEEDEELQTMLGFGSFGKKKTKS